MKTIVYILLLCFPVMLFAQSDVEEAQLKMYAKSLEEEVDYWVAKIGEWESSDTLNLLVLLDGDEYFGLAKNQINLYHADERINPTFVVALPSSVESRWKYYSPTKAEAFENSDDEMLDLFEMSGHFDAYSAFVLEELIPFLEKENKRVFTTKTIFGHSMGGLGALSFLLLENGAFDNYIVASPSILWDKYYLLDKLEKEAAEEEIPTYQFDHLFLSVAEYDMNYYEDGVTYFQEYFEPLRDQTDTQISFTKYEGESHMTVGLISLFEGILAVMK